jgi:hypothetical protein
MTWWISSPPWIPPNVEGDDHFPIPPRTVSRYHIVNPVFSNVLYICSFQYFQSVMMSVIARAGSAEQVQSQVVPSRLHSMADGSFKDVPEFFEVCNSSISFLPFGAHNPATGRSGGVGGRKDRESLLVSLLRPPSRTADDNHSPQLPFANSALQICVML